MSLVSSSSSFETVGFARFFSFTPDEAVASKNNQKKFYLEFAFDNHKCLPIFLKSPLLSELFKAGLLTNTDKPRYSFNYYFENVSLPGIKGVLENKRTPLNALPVLTQVFLNVSKDMSADLLNLVNEYVDPEDTTYRIS